MIKVAGDWTRRVYEIAAGGDEAWEEDGGVSGRNGESPSFLSFLSPRRTQAHQCSFPFKVVVSVSGPYGPATFIPSTFASVMIVVGGSGVSFALAQLEGIVSDCLAGDGRTREVELVWIVREAGELRFSASVPRLCRRTTKQIESDAPLSLLSAELLDYLLPSFQSIINLSQSIPSLSLSIRLACTSRAPIPTSASTRLRPLRLADSATPISTSSKLVPTITYSRRPDLVSLFDGLLKRTRIGGGVGICACGPTPLVESVEKFVDEVDEGRARRVGGVETFIE